MTFYALELIYMLLVVEHSPKFPNTYIVQTFFTIFSLLKLKNCDSFVCYNYLKIWNFNSLGRN